VYVELFLLLGVMTACSWPLWKSSWRRRRAPSILVSLALVGGVLGMVLVRSTVVSPPAPSVDPHIVKEDGWVGSDACGTCHAFRHATWHASYHRSMTQLANSRSILAPFDGQELELEGMVWRPERRGEEYWIKGWPTNTTPDGYATVESRVVMATGSHNYQLYWLESEDASGMSQFPIVWLVPEQLWIPRKSRFLMPPREHTPRETGRWKAHCIKCHSTYGRKEDLPSGETRVAELGISCEACHGQGWKHVEENHSPINRYLRHWKQIPQSTIVNPRHLAHDRSTEVCGQCHSLEIFLTEDKAQDWFHEGTHFRPGDVLSDHQTTVRGRFEDNPPEVRRYLDSRPAFLLPNCFWSNGVLRVAGREYNGMLESPCYQRGEMSCLSCHRLHRAEDDHRSLATWAEDQLAPGMRGDQACLECHPAFGPTEKRIAHTHHAADSTGSACYNCHMTYSTWGLLRAIRQHTVDSPSVANSLATGRPNAFNQCHLDRTLQWAADYLRLWYGLAPVALSEDQKTVAASILWTLRGDAVQRALMAWSLGWDAARRVSGTEWMVP